MTVYEVSLRICYERFDFQNKMPEPIFNVNRGGYSAHECRKCDPQERAGCVRNACTHTITHMQSVGG